MAMEWVQANIAAFGGDKDRAMIYDGGAGSVANHLAMPKSWSGLFNSAVMEVAGPNKWVIEVGFLSLRFSQSSSPSFLAFAVS
jgi:carboxylesterase type B